MAKIGVLDILLQSTLWLSFAAFCGAAIAIAFLGAAFDFNACLITAALVFGGYSLDRLSGMRGDADRINQPLRHQYFQKYGRWNRAGAVGSLALVLWLLASRSVWLGLLAVMLPLITWGLYTVGWKRFFPQARYARLKDVSFAKPSVVGLLWGVVLVFIPAAYMGLRLDFGLFWLYLYLSWRMALNTILFDVADMEGDRLNDTHTLPILLGQHNTLRLLAGANLVLLGWMVLMPGLSLAAQIAVGLSVFYAWVYLFLFPRLRNRHLFINLVVDGELIFTYGLFLVARFFLPG